MNAQVQQLLDAVEAGDCDALQPLKDLLEREGDARASSVSEAMEIDPSFIADVLFLIWSRYHLGESLNNQSWETLPVDIVLKGLRELPNAIADEGMYLTRADFLDFVKQAIATKKLSTTVARAIMLSRRLKLKRLLAQFEESNQQWPRSDGG